ncbi:MAG TPA: squalene/phytoene synthase family protein [Chryseolinea sp.]|nr:squalene/phytoene synthase family protein [Chryseolinea sp.]
MKELYDKVSIRCSEVTTHAYSTSFSIGIRCLANELRNPIYSIYGFVRLADEIVDTFHNYNRGQLLERFQQDAFWAIEERISLNPILNSFQSTVRKYEIEHSLIEQFMKSMEMDLSVMEHDQTSLNEYILGSAEAVGLMCLQVFCQGNKKMYDDLKDYAMHLGAAFQKINFLRDLQADFIGMGRNYFPGLQMERFDDNNKKKIEGSIKSDLEEGFKGIKKLPRSSRFGVYVAYVYYLALFNKIRNTPSEMIFNTRISIRRRQKATLLACSYVKHQLNLI